MFNFLALLWRGKLIIFACMSVFMLLGGYYAFFVAEDRFAATARLAMDLRKNQVVDVESVVSGANTDTASLNTELEFIRTEELVEKVVDKLDLTKYPEFNANLREQPDFSFDIAKNWLREQIVGPALFCHRQPKHRYARRRSQTCAVPFLLPDSATHIFS